MIGTNAVARAPQSRHAFDLQPPGTDASNLCPHGVEQVAEVLHMGLGRRVAHDCRALREHRGHDGIFGARDRGLIEKHVGPVQSVGGDREVSMKLDLSPERFERKKMGVHSSPTDDVTAGRRQLDPTKAGKQGPGQEQRRTNARGELPLDSTRRHLRGIDRHAVVAKPRNRRPQGLNDLEQRDDVTDSGYVIEGNRLIGQQGRGQTWQGSVLVASRADAT